MGLTTDVTIFEAKVCKSIFILHDLLLFTKKTHLHKEKLLSKCIILVGRVLSLLLKCTHFNDGLTQEIVRLPCKLLAEFRLQVVVFVPHSHLYPVRRIVALTRK